MRIVFIGNFTKYLNEGMKKTASYYKAGLSQNNEVLALCPKDSMKLVNFIKIKRFSPDIIHYTQGPALRSFFVMYLFGIACPQAITIMTATNPQVADKWLKILPYLKPSLILTQSKRVDRIFNGLGFSTKYLPNGVDIDTFKPIDEKQKSLLRNKYHVSSDKFIVLHVGHLRQNRNLEILCEIQNRFKDVQVIIVGSAAFKKELDVETKLTDSGCIIWKDYFEKINEVYCMSDCYVFPVNNSLNASSLSNLTGSVQIPLSILEAMACNLPVIATKYGGIPDLFKSGDEFYYYEDNQGMFSNLKEIIDGIEVKNRAKVLRYSWDNIIDELQGIYKEACANR